MIKHNQIVFYRCFCGELIVMWSGEFADVTWETMVSLGNFNEVEFQNGKTKPWNIGPFDYEIIEYDEPKNIYKIKRLEFSRNN